MGWVGLLESNMAAFDSKISWGIPNDIFSPPIINNLGAVVNHLK